MAHKEASSRKKHKPRNRSASVRTKPAVIANEIEYPVGFEGGNRNDSIAFENEVKDKISPIKSQESSSEICEDKKENLTEQFIDKSPELIDSIQFKQGENELKIVLLKRHNRMMRVQIFLNGDTEIRPVTYTGTSQAMNFWKLLKGSLKQEIK